jgi:hypothetical protein
MVMDLVNEIVDRSEENGFRYEYRVADLTNKYMQWYWRIKKADTALLGFDEYPKWVLPVLSKDRAHRADYLDAFTYIFDSTFLHSFMTRWKVTTDSDRMHDAISARLPEFFYAYLSLTESRTFRDIEQAYQDVAAAEEAERGGWDD